MQPSLSASPIVQCLQRAMQARNERQNCPNQSNSSAVVPGPSEAQNSAATTPSQSENASAERLKTGRRAQNVLTKAQKYQIAKWMLAREQEGMSKIPSKAVVEFPQFFRGATNANIKRAVRYWRDRHVIIHGYKDVGSRNNDLYMYRPGAKGRKLRISKTASGRGRKRSAWVTELHKDLCTEFERVRKCGVKVNTNILAMLARKLIQESTSDIYGPTHTDPRSGRTISDHIDKKWVERFMHSNRIVSRVQKGKLSLSDKKVEMVEREVSYHLGSLMRDFEAGVMDENFVYNADETHFVVDLNDGKTLAMKGDKDVSFADVVSGDVGMTMMVLLGGGCKAHLGAPFIIFQNDRSSYPIQGVPDNIPGVCYRSGPKGWMDSRVFSEWLGEKRIMTPCPAGKERVLFVDNASGHKLSEAAKAALKYSNTTLRFLPKNATDLCQPADSFIIQQIKTVWRRRWDEKRMDMIKKKQWVDWRSGSGKLTNPGKVFYLKLAADVVREVDNQRDSDGVSLSRKAMMGCGMALNLNGRWEVRQLFPHLQSIVARYPDNFNGTPVADSLELDGAVTESEEEG